MPVIKLQYRCFASSAPKATKYLSDLEKSIKTVPTEIALWP